MKAKVRFTASTTVPPERVLAAAVDFSERRPELWPSIDPKVYRVLFLGQASAEAIEGSAVMGGIWARERYDWSTPGVVRAEVEESNIFKPGSSWELRVRPRKEGGSDIEWISDRQMKGLKGGLTALIMKPFGKKLLAKNLATTLAILERQRAA
jgi:hypothetical protein